MLGGKFENKSLIFFIKDEQFTSFVLSIFNILFSKINKPKKKMNRRYPYAFNNDYRKVSNPHEKSLKIFCMFDFK